MIHVLDTFQLGRSGIVAATALETNDGVVLFDTGPESTFNNVAAGLRNAGIGLNDVRHVFVTHIHFDHSGAAWRFADLGATVYVHPRGARHLTDPAKLIKSATRIFGDDMQRLWGQIAPVAPERVKVLEDMAVVRVPPFEVHAIATPGHADHHHIYQWEDNVFGGDVAGVRLGNGPPVPPFVPPELHIESWHNSIARIRAINPRRLYLPHFGLVGDSVLSHLDELDERVRRWSEWFRHCITAGADEQQMIREFAEYEHNDLIAGSSSPATDHSSLVNDYETADPSYMAVAAAIRYWSKYHPEEIAAGA
jgi:glyoxylase-like metal-dependent hydrolase (beta-lactamase superfamily II)